MRYSMSCKAVVMFVACLLAGNAALAGSCGSNSCKSSVLQLRVQQTLVYVQLDLTAAELASLTNCTPYDGVFFTLDAGFGSFKEAYAGFLAARHAGTEVTIRTVDGSSNCQVSYMRVH